MKTDFYTKTMLTLIVLFLGILSFDRVYDSFIREAEASSKGWACKAMYTSWIEVAGGYSELTLELNKKGIQQIEMVMGAENKILVCMR